MADSLQDESGNELETLITKGKGGDEEAQLKIGKHYLRLAEVEDSAGESATQSVSWLIKASRQGNKEATTLLNECLQKKLGVNETNLNDVTWCLSTPELEKRARKAAQQLFRKINPFGDNSSQLSKQEFLERISELSQNKREKKILEKAGKSEIVSEQDFVDKVLQRLKGQGGISLNLLLQNDIEWEAYNNSSFIVKVSRYPGKTIAWVVDNAVDTAGSQGMLWLKSLFPFNQIYMLVVLFIYSLISIDAVLWIVPLIGFYVAIFALVISTMQMFYNRRKLNDVKVLAEMLERFNETFTQESAESAYSWSSLTPYVTFFVSLISTLLMFSAADKTWIPCSELVLVSAVITVACFFALSDSYDHLAMASVLLDNISTLPTVIKVLPRVPLLYDGLELITRSGISLPLLPGLYFEIGIPSVAYLVVPLLFLRMAMQKSWSGTYQILIPHLVCFFWWRVTVLFLLQSTAVGLLRASVGWGLCVILMPVVAIGFLLWIAYYFFQIFSFTNLLRVFTTFLLIGAVAAFGYWSRGGFHVGSSVSSNSKTGKVILAVILLLSSVPLAFYIVPEETVSQPYYVPYELYAEHCGPLKWEGSNVAAVMAECSHLTLSKVNWTGTVKQITVKRIENQAEGIIDVLPGFIGTWLKCTYGEEYPADCETVSTDDKFSQAICAFNRQQGRTCHLKNLNRYTFELSVVMVDRSEVKVEASHWFQDAVFRIKPMDRILFRAYLTSNLGNVNPILKLYNLQCETCEDPTAIYSGTIFQQSGWNVLVQARNALLSVWNFFLDPILVFKTEEVSSSML